MDPISAVGIASATAQFITFASQLISTTTEIYDSAGDASGYIANLDTSYSHLRTLCQSLTQASKQAITDQARSYNTETARKNARYNASPDQAWASLRLGGILQTESEIQLGMDNIYPEPKFVYSSLQVVIRDCESDSQYMLSIISKLKPQQSAGSLAQSFRTAFKTVWKTSEIRKVEERLRRSQGVLTTTIGQITNIYHTQHSQQLSTLRRESQLLGAKHSAQLSNMQNTLQEMEAGRKPHRSSENLKNEIDSLGGMMRHFSFSETKLYRELDIIRSLSFKTRQLRHDAILEAHQRTFQWVFKRPDKQDVPGEKKEHAESEMLKWLEQGEGVFWVSGKPGSGKSTFMKFIADHHKTSEALTQWSHPFRPIISSCYFWRSGTDMQKSLQGLFQTLLYDVFRCCPELIQGACHSRWSGEISSEMIWTENELKTALEHTSKQSEVPARFCYFIDGLDEYDGDHIDFCEYLTTLLGSNIKLCLSSRPWNVFNDSFGQDTAHKLQIHELTWSDILAYARDRLHRHPRWGWVASRTKQAEALAKTIATRSEGVFLWVFLVTRLLREGLTNDDSLLDLERRLSSFPTELEPFFKQMLESVPSFYQEKMAGTLHTALYAVEPLESMIYSFIDDEYDDKNYFRDLSVFQREPEWEQIRQERTVRRLNGRCRGLLEEQSGKVSFLHRTVADFLQTREMTDFLELTMEKDFKPGISILKANAAWLKTSSLEHSKFRLHESARLSDRTFRLSPFYLGVRAALRYVLYAERDPEIPKPLLDSIIDEIDSTLGDLAVHIDPVRLGYFADGYDCVTHQCRIFAMELPLTDFLRRKLSTKPSYLSGLYRSPISLALWGPMSPSSTWTARNCQVLDLVLQAGSNPNEMAAESTPRVTIWQLFLSKILPGGSLERMETTSHAFQNALEQGLILSLIKHGAHPRTKMGWGHPASPISILTLFVVAAFHIAWNEEVEEMYFRTLSSLIQRGAIFDRDETHHAPGGNALDNIFLGADLTGSDSEEGPGANAVSGQGHHEMIFGLFKTASSPTSQDEPGRKSQNLPIAKLVRNILPCAKEAHWPLEQYKELIEKALHVQRLSCISDTPMSLKRDISFVELYDE